MFNFTPYMDFRNNDNFMNMLIKRKINKNIFTFKNWNALKKEKKKGESLISSIW